MTDEQTLEKLRVGIMELTNRIESLILHKGGYDEFATKINPVRGFNAPYPNSYYITFFAMTFPLRENMTYTIYVNSGELINNYRQVLSKHLPAITKEFKIDAS